MAEGITVDVKEIIQSSKVMETFDIFRSSHGWALEKLAYWYPFATWTHSLQRQGTLNCPSGTQYHVCASATQQGSLTGTGFTSVVTF